MDYAQYKKLKEEIEAEHKKKLEALELIWRMCQNQNSSDAKDGADRSISTADAIRKVLEGLSGDFSADDIEQGLKDHHVKRVKRIAITNTLHRLVRRGELEIVKKGRGRISGVFRKKLQEASKT